MKGEEQIKKLHLKSNGILRSADVSKDRTVGTRHAVSADNSDTSE